MIHGRRAAVAILFCVLVGKLTLPNVRKVLTFGSFIIAPGEYAPLQRAATGSLPLHLGGQAFVGPFAIGGGVIVAVSMGYQTNQITVFPNNPKIIKPEEPNVNNGMIPPTAQIALWSNRMEPIGALDR